MTLKSAVAVQFAGAAFNALVSFALMAWLARTLGPPAFGQFVSALSLALVALVAIEAGWAPLAYRATVASPDEGRRIARRATGWFLLSGLALSAIAAAVWLPAAMALGCMVLVAASNLVSARLRGAGRFAAEAAWQAACRLASALAIVAVTVNLAKSTSAIFAAWALGLLACLGLAGWRALAVPAWPGWREGLALALPFVALEGAFAVVAKGDVAMLGLSRLEPGELARYAACTRFTEAGLLLFAPFANPLLREFRLRAAGDGFAGALRAALACALGLGVLAVLASIVAGTAAMRLVLGPEYESAGALLPWVASILPFAFANLVLLPALYARHRERAAAAWLAGAALAAPFVLIAGARVGEAAGAAVALAGLHALIFLGLRFALPAAGAR